jgi:hypothetical protein
MNSIDDETGRQPVVRQRRTDNSGFARAQRRHGVEEMCDTSRAIRDGPHDDGRRRLAVADRNAHTRRGQGANKTLPEHIQAQA